MTRAVANVAVTTAATSPPLLLTAGDSPSLWRSVKYELYDGALDETTTSHSYEAISKLRSLASTIRRNLNETAVQFDMMDHDEPPMELELPSSYDDGVGSRVWEASIALSLLQRSSIAPSLFSCDNVDACNVMELGAGIGLPGLDMARSASVSSVTLTDARPRLLDLAQKNARNVQRAQHAHHGPFARMGFERLAWGDGGGRSSNHHHKEEKDEASSATAFSAKLRAGDAFDLVIGSDICYEPEGVPALTDFLLELAAPTTILIGPANRPSFAALRDALLASGKVTVSERKVSLVCTNMEGQEGGVALAGEHKEEERDDASLVLQHEQQRARRLHSGGVHRVLVVVPARKRNTMSRDF